MKPIDFRQDLLPLKDVLFRMALRLTSSRTEAEDLTQDTLIRVWHRRSELQDVRSLEAYCLTVCRNLALDRIEKAENRNVSLDDRTEDPADVAYTAEEQMAHDEKLRLVHEIFNHLPEKQRVVLQLRDIEGKTYREMAEILHITEDQVRVTLHRARLAVRTRYEKIENYGL